MRRSWLVAPDQKVVLLAATDFPTLSALATVGAETMRRVGIEVEVVFLDGVYVRNSK